MASASNQQALNNITQITLDAVVEALVSLGEANGTTLSNLKKYFLNKLPSNVRSNDVCVQIKKVLKKGEKEGKVKRLRNRRFFPVVPGVKLKRRKPLPKPEQDDVLGIADLLRRRMARRMRKPMKKRRRKSRRRRRRRRRRCRRRGSMRRRRKRKKCRKRRRGRSRRRRKALGS
ncbi:hypothetical protein BsWGS_10547 [Bradybaena similaris]